MELTDAQLTGKCCLFSECKCSDFLVFLDEDEITKALSYISFSNLASVGCKPLGNDVNISGSDQP